MTIWTIIVWIVRIFQKLAAARTKTAEKSRRSSRRRSRSLLMKTNRRRSGPPQAHGPAGQPARTRTDYSQTGPRTAKRTEETGRGRERKDAYPVRRSLQPDQDWAWNPGIP